MQGIWKYAFLVHIFVSLVSPSRTVSGAEPYQMEISAAYGHFENDDNDESMEYILAVTQHFWPVNTSGHPFAEAAFLERIGGVILLISPSNFEQTSSLGIVEGDALSYGLFVNFSKPGQPIFIELSYLESDSQLDTIFIGDVKRKRYRLDIGLFVKDGFLVDLEYADSESDSSVLFLSNNVAFLSELTFKDKSYGVNSKVVKKLQNDTAINLQGSIRLNEFENPSEEGENTIIAISGDYYFNRMVSIGGSIATNSGDEKDNEGETYGVSLLFFLNPHFSVAFLYDQFFADNPLGVDDELYIFAISARL